MPCSTRGTAEIRAAGFGQARLGKSDLTLDLVPLAARIPKARWDEDLEAAVADSDSAEEPLQVASEIYSASFGVTSEG